MGQPFDSKAATANGALVNAAYTAFLADQDDLTPPVALPPGWELIAWIQMSDFLLFDRIPRFYGFIARSQADSDAHVIAIRGTEGWVEWYDDFSIFRVPFSQDPDGGWVANGFDRIYKTLKVRRAIEAGETATPPHPRMRTSRPTVALEGSFADQIEDIIKDRPPKAAPTEASITVTGHSLGGALSTLYVIEHARKGKSGKPQICTFGSPRVGDAAFAQEFNELGLTSWRIVNKQDLVPHIPFDILGYKHVDALQLFDSRDLVRWSPVCCHEMDTYLALIDPAGHKPDPDCQSTARA
jgi:triacylglycerol lipase